MISISFIVYSFLALIGLFIFLSCFTIVKQQQVAIVETLGKFTKTMGPGFHLVIPIIQRVAGRVNMRIREIDSNIDVKTKDNTFVNLPVSIQLVPNVNNVKDAFYKLDNPESQIKSWILNSVRSIASGMLLEELYTDKEHIITEVRSVLVEKLSSFGYTIEAVLVDQPRLPEEMQRAYNRNVTARREAEAATQEGEAIRIKQVAHATAEAESHRVRAKGMADARAVLAKGLTESIEQLEGHHLDPLLAVNTLVELNRLDVIRETGANGNIILFDVSPTNGGINNKEILALLAPKKKLEREEVQTSD